MANRFFLGLVHYPVYNKHLETVATSVTNLDIHDIARCVTTYNLEKYFLIHPLPTQHKLVQEIIDYWQKGYGAQYNPDRKEALNRVELIDSIERARAKIQEQFNGPVYTVVTDARVYPRTIGYLALREIIEKDENDNNYLFLFGTGWGMTREVMESADYVLEPIYGKGTYNHLSVRSAVAIILDRIFGEKWWK